MTIEEWACSDDARTDPFPLSDFITQAGNIPQWHGRAHVSNAKHSVGNEHRKHAVQSLGKHSIHMHVPQAGYQIFTRTVHNLHGRSYLHAITICHLRAINRPLKKQELAT